MRVTLHFDSREFGCKDQPKTPYPAAWIATRLRPLCETLEVVRDALGGRAVTVVSGYRTPAWNARIGGARRSQHVEGRAADIRVAGVSPARVHTTVLRLHAERQLPALGGLGAYNTFSHLDVRLGDRLVRWRGKRVAAEVT